MSGVVSWIPSALPSKPSTLVATSSSLGSVPPEPS
eukprot:CAMPEP_0179034578 /NCGR_PEP_ID=MMETSP0796-20121207/12680_1 /TAXON_ID=73915 /ORGANISM="Pyrodinium bahamense, Strain pbaha01" /LENGTH=34 /DNA_ID= /DNA_START= /DNA_END= /DNA_ORIENTATION=